MIRRRRSLCVLLQQHTDRRYLRSDSTAAGATAAANHAALIYQELSPSRVMQNQGRFHFDSMSTTERRSELRQRVVDSRQPDDSRPRRRIGNTRRVPLLYYSKLPLLWKRARGSQLSPGLNEPPAFPGQLRGGFSHVTPTSISLTCPTSSYSHPACTGSTVP